MKKVKNYIAPELAKKKIARYKYWNIKDESGISITSSEDINDGRSFEEVLDAIIDDNVDAEVQVKFGVNEQSSRQNAPIFIRINETIEWIEPEEDDTININGVPHKVDKNGNVNINLNTPTVEPSIIENPTDYMRQEMEMRLEGLQKENELKEQRFQSELHNKMAEQTIKFKEMMLSERENRVKEREQNIAIQEAEIEEKKAEISEDLRGYVKMLPATLGSVLGEWIKGGIKKDSGLGKTEKRTPKPKNQVQFEIEPEAPENIEEFEIEDSDTAVIEMTPDFENVTDQKEEEHQNNTTDENI